MANHTLVEPRPTTVAGDTERTVRIRPTHAATVARRAPRLRPLMRSIADRIDRHFWSACWGVLLGLAIGAVAAGVDYEFGRRYGHDVGQWYGMGTMAAGLVVWFAVVARIVRARRAKRVVITPLPEAVPSPHRFDRALVLAAINGRPLRRPSSLCEKTAIATVLDRRGQDAPQIARLLRCEPAFAAWLLSFEVPDSAWTVAQ